MAGEAPARNGVLRYVPPPAVAVRLGLLILGFTLVALGGVAFATVGTPGAISPGQAALRSDGGLTVAGKIDLVWLATAPTVTHVRLGGAPDLDIHAPGDLTSRLAAGAFVAVVGVKSGGEIEAESITPARDPVAEGAPPLALGALVLGALAVEQLASRGYSVRSLVAVARRWRLRPRDRREPDEE